MVENLYQIKTKNLWLDLKIHDIPNTSSSVIKSIKDHKKYLI